MNRFLLFISLFILDMIRDFSALNYKSFQRLAQDSSLSQCEKVGFPDSCRRGFEDAIVKDICSKLRLLRRKEKTVLDIGPGCSTLARKMIRLCKKQKHRLLLADSKEMLAHLPNASFIDKVAGMFPDTVEQIRKTAPDGIDVILCYSVLQYLFVDTNPWKALDYMLGLLNSGGEMLLGDIPNLSMRNRFFSSDPGRETHRKFTRQEHPEPMKADTPGPGKIDDDAVLAILARMRAAGCDAFVMPQAAKLAFSTRREDILIRKP